MNREDALSSIVEMSLRMGTRYSSEEIQNMLSEKNDQEIYAIHSKVKMEYDKRFSEGVAISDEVEGSHG